MRPQGVKAGQYMAPHYVDPKALEDADFRGKVEQGPMVFMTVMPPGVPAMGKPLVLSLLFNLVVSVVVGYIVTQGAGPGTEYLDVFQVASTSGWMAYGFGMIPMAIWFGVPWNSIVKGLIDALVYGLLMGGVFGWLWPM